MANETITVTKEGLQDAVAKIKNAAVAVQSVFDNCDGEIARVKENFQTTTAADSAGAVIDKYESYKSHYESFLSKIIQRAETITITDEIVEQADKQQAAKASEAVDVTE